MSTKKNEKRTECKSNCAKDEKRSEKGVKAAGPKWGTPEWAYAHPWTEMDRKRRARVFACGALGNATKAFIMRLEDLEELAKVAVPGDGYRMCDILRNLCVSARNNLVTATYDLSYVVSAMVASDLVAAWAKADDAK